VRDSASRTKDTPYGTLDSEVPQSSALPASLSRKAIEGVLRHDLGFQGLVVTDAFDMGALVAHFDAGEDAVLAIEAGNDQILKPADVDAAIAAVRNAVRGGRIPESRIDQSVRRILEAKRRVRRHPSSMREISATIDREEHQKVAREIARRAITLVRDEARLLPIRRSSRVLIVSVSDFAEVASPVSLVATEIAARTTAPPMSMMLDARSDAGDAERVADAARDADVVLLALAIRTRSGAGHIALPEAARRLMEMLPPEKTIGVSFGSPYVLRDLPALRTYVCAYGTQPVLQIAAIRALFGESAMTGQLPVTLP
jgi:beta-N-acetylhexosaminidase